MKVFQVTSKWTVFRIPMYDKLDDKDAMYLEMRKWLAENCSGTYKIFHILHGNKGKGIYGNTTYDNLLEVDLLSDVDVMAFKLRWIE